MKKLPSLKTFETYLNRSEQYHIFQNTIVIHLKNNVIKEYPYSLFQKYVDSKLIK